MRKINGLEAELVGLSDEELRAKTDEFRGRLGGGESLDELLCEAFAVVREASKRVFGMRVFDVQLIGGIILHKGAIAEMKTGEGKTLVATLPAYLNALTGETVYILSVNDYLVKRDSGWMGKLYRFLGLEVGCVTGSVPQEIRAREYAKDIVYVENKELGFDYLRDNMRMDERFCLIGRKMNFAIVDEVDSILIDEARTPLIISGPVENSLEIYPIVSKIIQKIEPEAYETEEKAKQIFLNENGYLRVEKLLAEIGILGAGENLYGFDKEITEDPVRQIFKSKLIHAVNQCLKAGVMFKEGADYLVREGNVHIIDEFTGRVMEGRRYSDGLHQALEAKHGLKVQEETQTVSSITYQNLFALFKKLAGMTGTAATEAVEFEQIYKLEVVSVPTNIAIKREDLDDLIYRNEAEKFSAIVAKVRELHEIGRPVLIGVTSINKSEILSKKFSEAGLKHNLLNAKNHEKEAEIIAQAGRKNAITIATNMAGRGTDIVLGGNLEARLRGVSDDNEIAKIKSEWEKDAGEVKALGGLFVLGSERHESRRIDNQLRGRSGRQGDSGTTQFYLSLEDDLLRIFGGNEMRTVLSKFGFKEGESMNHPLLNRVLESAQKKVENYNYEIRKSLIRYDTILHEQRRIIFEKRFEIITQKNNLELYFEEAIREIADKFSSKIAQEMGLDTSPEEQNAFLEKFSHSLTDFFEIQIEPPSNLDDHKGEGEIGKGFIEAEKFLHKTEPELKSMISDLLLEKFTQVRESLAVLGEDEISGLYKNCLLSSLDYVWKNHLYEVEHIRQNINLRAYAQKDPFMEYKFELFELFAQTLYRFNELSLIKLLSIRIKKDL